LELSSTKPYVWMLCGSGWFSVMAVLAHAAGERVDWQVVAVARSALAAAFALAAALVVRAELAVPGGRVLWVRSLAGSTSMVGTFYALTHMLPSQVLTLTNTFPIWVALLSWPLEGRRPTLGVTAAVLCSVLGVFVIFRLDFAGFTPAAWAAVGASVATAVAMLGLNRLRGVSSLGIVVHFSVVSTFFGVGALVVFDRTGGPADTGPAALGLLFGVGATATIGQVFLTLAFRAGSATKVSVVGLSQVVMVSAIEAALGTPVDGWAVVGTALVLGPTAWLMLRDRGHPKAEPVAIE
jgi:drug/metabolite transporter (DMT)-like permease